jgi:hypothetical protein
LSPTTIRDGYRSSHDQAKLFDVFCATLKYLLYKDRVKKASHKKRQQKFGSPTGFTFRPTSYKTREEKRKRKKE